VCEHQGKFRNVPTDCIREVKRYLTLIGYEDDEIKIQIPSTSLQQLQILTEQISFLQQGKKFTSLWGKNGERKHKNGQGRQKKRRF